MIKRRTTMGLAAVAVAALLAGCGGGGVLEIRGFAATGAAIVDGDVTAMCVNGPELTGKTAADGTFTLELARDQGPPCLVRVSKGGTTLFSFAGDKGRLNVTPLTDLSVRRALGADPATVYGGFGAGPATTLQNGITAAKAAVKAQIQVLTNDTIQGDLFTGAFKVGDPDDRVLDKLNAKLQAINRPLSELQANASAGSDLMPAAPSVARGTLIGSLDAGQSLPAAVLNVAMAQLVPLTGAAQCGVNVRQIRYNTVGILGEPATASGALLVPTDCVPNGALVAYAKGTDVDKTRTLANPNDGETALLMMMYAAQGYTVVSTDYLGFAESNYTFHPYLHADTEASAVIDSIRAARRVAQDISLNLSGKVMLTGYSQGGHASMAAHRAIERDLANEIAVVAGAHLAGPYALSAAMQSGVAIAGYQFFVPYMVTSWQKVYGNVYDRASDAFRSPYVDWMESLLPSTTYSYTTLVTQGRVPSTQLLPAAARDALFQPAFLAQLNDPASGLIKAAKANDLLGWSPVSPVLLCGGSGDPTIPPALFQTPMKSDFDSRPGSYVISVDVDPYVQAQYGSVLESDPVAYYGNYHGTYAPPFCAKAARDFFDQMAQPPT